VVTADSGLDGRDPIPVRRAVPEDESAILDLIGRSLGALAGENDRRFFRWKHRENVFGESPMWVAEDRGRVVGFRTFLHWKFWGPQAARVAAVRAVDTATDPTYQGRGIFTRLTLAAVDELRADGVDLIFNTPNQRSLPGYIKMGWSVVGRLPAAVMTPRASSLLAISTARRPATPWSIEIRAGEPAAEVFADHDAIADLLSARPPESHLATARSPEFLAWRYGYDRLHYRVVLVDSSPSRGLAVFRLRRRGRAIEAVVADVLVPDADPLVTRSLMRDIARLTRADYLIRLSRSVISTGPFVRLPRAGPILVGRRLHDGPVPTLRTWDLALGDIELL
jgi:GNAT superfamily N-acetyltransferase